MCTGIFPACMSVNYMQTVPKEGTQPAVLAVPSPHPSAHLQADVLENVFTPLATICRLLMAFPLVVLRKWNCCFIGVTLELGGEDR